MLLPLIPFKPTSSHGLPDASPGLVRFGLKFTSGGTHISRTIMHEELEAVMSAVLPGSSASDYRDAILQRNVHGRTTDSTGQKSLRHLRDSTRSMRKFRFSSFYALSTPRTRLAEVATQFRVSSNMIHQRLRRVGKALPAIMSRLDP